MFKLSALLIGTLLLAGPVVTAQQPAQPQRPAALQSIDDRTSGHEEDRRLLPALLGRAHRLAVPRDLAVRYRLPVLDRAVGGPRLERHRPRPRPGRRRPHRPVPAHGPARDAGAGQPVVPIEQQEPARAQVGRRFVRQVDPVGLRRRGRIERPRAGRRDRLLPARRDRTRPARCGRATTASIARAARSTCPTPATSRRTPKST